MLTAGVIADAILENPSYSGQPIRLVTCHGSTCRINELSEALDGVEILALPTRVDLNPTTGVPREVS